MFINSMIKLIIKLENHDMERTWNNNYDIINDMKDMDFFNNTAILTINGNLKFNILPNKLTCLDCRYNQLSNLPTLPNTLTCLYCYNNQLSSLPDLPYNLTFLNCSNNQLSNLSNLPNV